MPPGERQTAQSISLQGRAGEVAALPAPREARHGTALQPPAVVSGTQQGLSKPQVEDSKGRTKQGARGDNALLLHPCSSPHPTCLSLFLSPTTLSHHIWHRGKKMSGEEKHLKQTSSCPACDAVFLSERRGDGSSKDWGNKNSLTKPLLCSLHLWDAGLRQERGSHGEVLCHRVAPLAGKPNEHHLFRYTKSMLSYIPEPLNTRQAICLLLW